MRTPTYSVLTMTGPNRLLKEVDGIHIVNHNTLFVGDGVREYGDWLVKSLSHYGYHMHTERPRILDYFTDVVRFPISDDYGEFPDTSGYERDDWETIESDMEDPALMKFMGKCVDATYERLTPHAEKWAKDFDDVEDFISSPKFGGKVFLCAGVVMVGEKHESKIIQVPTGTTIENLKKKKAFSDIVFSNMN